MILESASFISALYMTIITLSTVGFAEVVILHTASRILTIIIIISGLTIGTITMGTITTYLVSGEISERMRGKRMKDRLMKVRDHIIVAGYGKLGREIARELILRKHAFCVIEQNPDHVKQAVEKGILVLQGDASDDEILLEAGVEHAHSLIAALTGESGNVMVTIAARTLNPDIIIVARGVEESSEAKLTRAGANRIELPFRMGAKRMTTQALNPSLIEFFDLFMGRLGYNYQMREFILEPDCALVGKSIIEANIRRVTDGALIMAIKRADGDVLMHPEATSVFRAEDRLLILGDVNNMIAFEELIQDEQS